MGSRSILGAIAFLVSALASTAPSRATAPRSGEVTKSDILEVLLTDLPGERAKRTYEELDRNREKYYSILIEIIDERRDDYAVANALPWIARPPSDPARLGAVRRLVERIAYVGKPSKGRELMLISAIRALGQIGESQDAPTLLRLLRDIQPRPAFSVEYWRRNIIEAVEKIGDEKAAEEMEQAINKMASGLTADQIRKDETFREGFAALGRMKYRLLLQRSDACKKTETPQDPAPKKQTGGLRSDDTRGEKH
jgi:hypothetical protein